MRSLLAGAVGLSLSLGSAVAQTGSPLSSIVETPAVTLGRPVPAASLGRPVGSMNGTDLVQPAGFRPAAAAIGPVDTAPLLAPIVGSPTSAEPNAPPRPMPTDTGPATSAVPPAAAPMGPSYGPVGGYPMGAAPAPVVGCDNCAPGGAWYGGDPNAFTGYGYGYGGSDGSRIYTSADVLLLWVPTISTPLPVALRSPVGNLPGATVAISNTDLISSTRVGARFGAGIWFDPCRRRAIDGSFFFVGPNSRDFVATTDANNVLLRPYIVVNGPVTPPPVPGIPGNPNFADVIPDPGNIRVHTDSFLMGGDLNYRRRMLEQCGNSLDALVGFRYMHLDESITISESANLGGAVGVATLTDRFRTINNFYGVQVGMAAQKQWGRWSADFLLKVASGTTASIVEASGSNNFDPARPNAGLFVQDSNAGRYQSNHFSVVPEIGINVGFQLRPRLRVHMGYTGIYWSNVLRPGEQIDPIVDQTKVPLPPGVVPAPFDPLPAANPHPVLTFPRSDYYAHGLNFGITIKW